MKRVIVTGGCGFIGSHTVVQLIESGYDVTVIDNLSNSSRESLERVKEITGVYDIPLLTVDLKDKASLVKVFSQCDRFDACIHFAALKAVGESVSQSLRYYQNNVGGTLNLLEVLDQFNCKAIVFSSSATVYGTSAPPMVESTKTGTGISSPYGRSKFMMEQMMMDLQAPQPEWRVVLLRYFNPVGAHESGKLGEDPRGRPNNLMPFVQRVAVGKLPVLGVYGRDYDTRDGTGIRDYIHVTDLAHGHVLALRRLRLDSKQDPISNDGAAAAPMLPDGSGVTAVTTKKGQSGSKSTTTTTTTISSTSDTHVSGFCDVFNLGSGRGHSVLEVVHEFSKACGHEIPYKFMPRRAGDVPQLYAGTDKAERELGFKTTRSLADMCRDCWRWISRNPDGFPTVHLPTAKMYSTLKQSSYDRQRDAAQETIAALLDCVKASVEVRTRVQALLDNPESRMDPGQAFSGFHIVTRKACVECMEVLVKSGISSSLIESSLATLVASEAAD